MFLLKILPTTNQIAVFAKQFPELEPETVAATVRLLKAASLITVKVEAELIKHDLTQAKFIALMVLRRGPEYRLRPVEIATAMGISKKNTSRLLDAMIEDGLVKVEDHKSDNRSYEVEATKKGINRLKRVLPEYYRTLNFCLRTLGVEKKKGVVRAMDLIINNLELSKV